MNIVRAVYDHLKAVVPWATADIELDCADPKFFERFDQVRSGSC